MITLGITGRSGCGKSTVTAVFAAHGVPLADADQLSREILLPGSDRKSTRLNSSHIPLSRMPSSA